jgi:DamX protein
MAQRPGHYTIQVLSGTSEAAVRAQAERLGLAGPAVVYPYRLAETRRFALLYGVFPDRAAASAALEALPAGTRGSAPWVRAFRDLQQLGAGAAAPE